MTEPTRATIDSIRECLQELGGSSCATSVEGRPIMMLHRVLPATSRKTIPGHVQRILVVGGVHGDEASGVDAVMDLAARQANATGARPDSSEPALADVHLWLIPLLNPDGYVRKQKNNAHDVDLNRNFPARNFTRVHEPRYDPGPRPLSEPESLGLARLIATEKIEAVVAVHSPFACVNFDGPAKGWAEKVSVACGWPVWESIGYPTPGSLGTWLGSDCGIPILTLELPPGTLTDFRAAAAAALDTAIRAGSGLSLGATDMIAYDYPPNRVVSTVSAYQESVMDKDLERSFLDTVSKGLISLPFDLKVLLEAVSDEDLEHDVRQLAASAVVHIITSKDGNVDPPVRHLEDVIMLRLALAKISAEGGEGAATFRDRFSDNYAQLDSELGIFRGALGDLVDWLDSRWAAMQKLVYAKKKISMFVDDEEVGTFLYDEGLKFATNYPITEKSLVGRAKQAQPFVDHLLRKREQDKRKITTAP